MHSLHSLQTEALLLWLFVGLVAGALAHFIAGGRGSLLGNIVVGLLGAVVGGYLANFFGIAFYGLGGEIIVSTVGALILLALFGAVARRTV